MKVRMAMALLSLMLVLGCNGGGGGSGGGGGGEVIKVETPEQRAALAKAAGEAAALAYLTIDKPSDEQAKVIQAIIDKIRESLVNWKEGGFITALPEIEKLADELFPTEEQKAYRLAAKKLASMLLDELDKLFKKHPEWKDKGVEVAGIVGKFLDGASESFKAYIKA
jgi:hypothetical protein